MVWAPLINTLLCAVLHGSKLMTVLAMLCGCLTVIVGKEAPAAVSALLWTSYRTCRGGFVVDDVSELLWDSGFCIYCITVVCV